MILGSQIKAARVLLEMSQTELAEIAKTSIATIKRIEKSKGNYKGSAELFYNIQSALEKRGVKFENDDNSYGVKLFKIK